MSAVVVTYLEQRDPAELEPAAPPRVAASVEVEHDPAVNRWCYVTIGGDWAWTQRLGWSDAQWARYAEGIETLVARVGGERAGYAELVPRAGGEVEIAMFGLRREFHGLGLGGWLLTAAARRAWELAGDTRSRRVWLHTCTLDGPHALANYQARGFAIYRRAEAA